jgi:hypothetical protein
MKKAKEYAAEWLDDPTDQRLWDTALAMITDEVKELMAMRRSYSNSTLVSVLQEQERKWLAFANRVNSKLDHEVIDPAGFKAFALAKLPMLRDVWR